MHRTRTQRAALLAAAAIGLGLSAAAHADPLTVFKIADEWGTINPTGPRAGVNGVRFWNAEGANNGNFASTAPFRFYMADVAAQFDAQFGAGQWKVSTVNIVFSQSNSGFTAAGGVKLFWFENDALPITNGVDDGSPAFSPLGVSELRYASGANALDTTLADGATSAAAIFGSVSLADNYQFTSTGGAGDWPLDVLAPKNLDGAYKLVNPEDPNIQVGGPHYNISTPIVSPSRPFRSDTAANFDAYTQRVQSNLDLTPIAADIESGADALSFILVPDAGTAATYKGNAFGGDYPARIYITADLIGGAPRLPGDANLDNIVNQLDINMVIDNWLNTGATWEVNGDVTEDGIVNQLDINRVIDNWLSTAPAPALAAMADGGGMGTLGGTVVAVPEPASIGAIGLATGIGLLRRVRRRRAA